MKLIHTALLLGLATATATAVGCSSNGVSPNSSHSATDGTTGSAGMQLTVDPGVVINSVSYTVTGPNGFTATKSVDVSNSNSILFTVPGLPSGGPYTVALSATSTDGKVTCGGSSPAFTVVGGQTVGVSVALQCHKAKPFGSAAIDAGLDVCANIDGIEASPQETTVGNSVTLTAYASDTSTTQTISYTWSATSGTIATANAATTTFTCTAPGAATVTLAVTDGTCGDMQTITVQCDGTVDAGTGTIDSGSDASDSGTTSDASDGGNGLQAQCNAFVAANNSGPNALGAQSNTCTTTELALFGKDTTGGCLSCAFLNGCMDDTFANTAGGFECDDFTAPADKAACNAALHCDLGDTNDTFTYAKSPVLNNIVDAFCAGSSTCASNPTGVCAAAWKAGFPSSDTNQQIIDADTVKTFAAGRGNAVVSCALGNACSSCF